jgi:hypothetical protein
MNRKVIITESQLAKLVGVLQENEAHDQLVRSIYNDLATNYEPAVGSFNDGSEFEHQTMVTKKADGSQLSMGALRNYLADKFLNVNNEFIEQVITDWYNGVLDGKNYQLTRNVNFS